MKSFKAGLSTQCEFVQQDCTPQSPNEPNCCVLSLVWAWYIISSALKGKILCYAVQYLIAFWHSKRQEGLEPCGASHEEDQYLWVSKHVMPQTASSCLILVALGHCWMMSILLFIRTAQMHSAIQHQLEIARNCQWSLMFVWHPTGTWTNPCDWKPNGWSPTGETKESHIAGGSQSGERITSKERGGFAACHGRTHWVCIEGEE